MVGHSRSLSFPNSVRRLISLGTSQFIVTGAGGWLGKATLEMLDESLGEQFVKRVFAFARTKRLHTLYSGRSIILHPLSDLAGIASNSTETFLAHFAFLTREKVDAIDFTAYLRENRFITEFVTQQAVRLGVLGTFSTSSGAVYKKDRALEDDLSRNPYGFLKLEEEAAFSRLREKMRSRSQICRVFNLSGPFINKEYALSSMLTDLLARRPISIRAAHDVVRSYAHVRDVVSVGFAGMLGLIEPSAQPYDTAGDERVELQALAERIRIVLSCTDLDIVRPARTLSAEDRYVGDGDAFVSMIRKISGQLVSLNEQIRDTATFLKRESS